ncbi:MAG TPA: hypothetical protein VLW65_15250 [Bryobacteraceae bacterium]|nr:hypothetical protein [Bryobacteraceae bacterium]
MSLPYLAEQDSLSEDRKAAVVAELARVLESHHFRGSRRCCRFLEYSVQQVLKGCAQEGLKERTIGIKALQRPPDYDTGEDAIVRVTANEVRKRLAQYYQEAGNSANPAIALPPGSYAAVFHWPAAPPQTTAAKPEQWKPARFDRRLMGGLVLLVLIVCLALYAIPIRPAPSASHAAASQPRTSPRLDPLWSRLFNGGQKTNIVVSDAVYREIQYFLGRDVSLSEYLAPGYPNSLLASAKPEARGAIAFLGRQQTTSIGSATLGSRLLTFGSRMGGDPVIRYPHHINAREFNTDNFILLGSRLSIPWEELFDPSLNFPLVREPATEQFYLRNRAPRAGERSEYRESDNQEETYADIALLPNLADTGTVLILNGIDMLAAEAAGEFAINGSLSTRLASVTASRSRQAEILIRVRAIAGTVAKIEVVAER